MATRKQHAADADADVGGGEQIAGYRAAVPVRARPGAKTCDACEHELVTIRITVDGSDLVLDSCQRCDERRWHFAGEQIDLQRVLAEVGEHAGRRR